MLNNLMVLALFGCVSFGGLSWYLSKFHDNIIQEVRLMHQSIYGESARQIRLLHEIERLVSTKSEKSD